MPQYLVANYLPDDFDPSAVTEAMIEEIHALNREMIAAGVRTRDLGVRLAICAILTSTHRQFLPDPWRIAQIAGLTPIAQGKTSP